MATSNSTEMTTLTKAKIRVPKITVQDLERDTINDPNIWFAKMFPESKDRFGPAFLQLTGDDMIGLPRFVPLEINVDFFAHALGGDRHLGHRVVYYQPEETFYFYDPRLGCFCPTTEAKLAALLSSYLIQCAQESGGLVEVAPLFTKFRDIEVLNAVIRRARALLEADSSFFSGEQGNRRMIDGKIIESTAKASYELFVEKELVKIDSSAITVTDAFHHYFTFCRLNALAPLSRQEFASLVAEVVRVAFGCGVRRDVRGRNGKQTAGWVGLGLRVPETSVLGLS